MTVFRVRVLRIIIIIIIITERQCDALRSIYTLAYGDCLASEAKRVYKHDELGDCLRSETLAMLSDGVIHTPAWRRSRGDRVAASPNRSPY